MVIIGVLALPLWFVRLILDPWVTVVTTLEILEPERPGRWADAESVITSPVVITEALVAQSGLGPRQSPEAALRRLMLSRNETATHLIITLQMRSDVYKSREDRTFLDGVFRAFARRYTRVRVIQDYPATAYTGNHYGELDWLGLLTSCVVAVGVVMATLKTGGSGRIVKSRASAFPGG